MIYNEIEPFAAAWLRELIKANAIPQGTVDERFLEDITPDELWGAPQAHFFAGIGVWPYALRAAGWPDELVTWTGSCPCQPFSAAGQGKGFADERHLWPSWFWLVEKCRPQFIFGEQVSGRAGKAWLDVVFTDLEALGYTCGAVSWGACGVGAPHIRKRLYWVAHRLADSGEFSTWRDSGWTPSAKRRKELRENGNRSADDSRNDGPWSDCEWLPCSDGKARPVKSGLPVLASRVINRVGKLRGYGNALCAPQAVEFIKAVIKCLYID